MLNLNKEKIIGILRQQAPYLAAEYGVKRMGLFGSYAKGEPQKQSDVDLVAEFYTPIGLKFMEFIDYLEQLLEVPVDVLTPEGIRGIRNLYIAKEIQETVLYV